MNALKRFGLGLLWVFLIPFILLGIAVVGVLGFINFPIQLVIMIVNFFRGKKAFPLFEEDEKAMAILQKAIDKKNGEVEAPPTPAPSTVFVQQNYYGAVPPPPGGLPYGQPQYPQQGIPYQNPQAIPGQMSQGLPGYQNPQPLPGQVPQGIPYTQVPPYQNPQPEFMTQGQLPSPEPKQGEMPKIELSSLPQYDDKEDE